MMTIATQDMGKIQLGVALNELVRTALISQDAWEFKTVTDSISNKQFVGHREVRTREFRLGFFFDNPSELWFFVRPVNQSAEAAGWAKTPDDWFGTSMTLTENNFFGKQHEHEQVAVIKGFAQAAWAVAST